MGEGGKLEATYEFIDVNKIQLSGVTCATAELDFENSLLTFDNNCEVGEEDNCQVSVASTQFIEESKQTNHYGIMGGIILCTMVGYYIFNNKNKNMGIENS